MTDCTAPRHLPHEPERAAAGAFLCRGCQYWLRRDLQRLPALYAALADLLEPCIGGAYTDGGAALPYHDGASATMDRIARDLEAWVMVVIGERQPAAWPVRTVPAMAGWLSGWDWWIPSREWSWSMAADLAAGRHVAAAITDPRPRTDIPVDRCPRCPDGMLRAAIPLTEGDRRPTLITCTDCGHEWDTTQWLGLGKIILARKAAAAA